MEDNYYKASNGYDDSTEIDYTYDSEVYEWFVLSVLKRINVLYTSSLIHALTQSFPELTPGLARSLLNNMQLRNKLLLASNDITMTTAAYHDMVNDKFGEYIHHKNSPYRVDGKLVNLNRTREGREVMECFKVASDLMPGAFRFVVGGSPWLIQFVMPAKGSLPARLFQITYFRKGEEFPDGGLINTLPKQTGEREQSQMRRIVLLENPDAVDLVPKGCGISKILGLDSSDFRGFRVLKSYSVQDSWNKFAD